MDLELEYFHVHSSFHNSQQHFFVIKNAAVPNIIEVTVHLSQGLKFEICSPRLILLCHGKRGEDTKKWGNCAWRQVGEAR